MPEQEHDRPKDRPDVEEELLERGTDWHRAQPGKAWNANDAHTRNRHVGSLAVGEQVDHHALLGRDERAAADAEGRTAA
jgi:hypothetical protein